MLRKLTTIAATTLTLTGLSATTVFAGTDASTASTSSSTSATTTATSGSGTSTFDELYNANLTKEQNLLQSLGSSTTSTPQTQLVSQAVQALNSEIPKLYASEQTLQTALPGVSTNNQLARLQKEQTMLQAALTKVQGKLASIDSTSTSTPTMTPTSFETFLSGFHHDRFSGMMKSGQQRLQVLQFEQTLLQKALTQVTSAIKNVQNAPQKPSAQVARLQQVILALQTQDIALTNQWLNMGQTTPSSTQS